MSEPMGATVYNVILFEGDDSFALELCSSFIIGIMGIQIIKGGKFGYLFKDNWLSDEEVKQSGWDEKRFWKDKAAGKLPSQQADLDFSTIANNVADGISWYSKWEDIEKSGSLEDFEGHPDAPDAPSYEKQKADAIARQAAGYQSVAHVITRPWYVDIRGPTGEF